MITSYTCDIGDGKQIVIQNRENQTIVTQASGSTGQQQNQRSGFDTGAWTIPPTLFRTATGLILRVESTEGQFFIGLEGQQIGQLSSAPPLSDAEVLLLRRSSSESDPAPMKPMELMKPMRPMEPMKPMEMRIGTMQMQMHSGMAEPEETDERFCGQCGRAAAPSDRFCTRCGHRLT